MGENQTAEGTGAIVAFNGAGRIVGSTERRQQGFLGRAELLLRNTAIPAKLQLAQSFLPGQLLLVKVDTGRYGDNTLAFGTRKGAAYKVVLKDGKLRKM